MTTLSARHAGVTLGLAGFLLSSATVAPGGAGPAADTAGHGTGWSIVSSPNPSRTADNTLVQVSAGSATNAWAVGYSGGVGSFRTMIQRWNGSRWTVQAAIDHAVPMPAISAALYARFASRQEDSPAMKVVAALRNQFGGHAVTASATSPEA